MFQGLSRSVWQCSTCVTFSVKAIQSIVQRRQSFTEALLGIAPTDPSNAGLQDVEDEDLLVGAIVTAARIVQVTSTAHALPAQKY